MLKLLLGILSGAVGAWLISLFGLDDEIINGVSQLFHITFTKEAYYFVFMVLGLIAAIIELIKTKM